MIKFFDELIEKKAQESLKRENEQNIRKARLAELQEKNKGIKRRLLHPVNSVNDGKEIKKLKEDIPDDERLELRKRFDPAVTPKEDKSALDVILFSEVGCEGLD